MNVSHLDKVSNLTSNELIKDLTHIYIYIFTLMYIYIYFKYIYILIYVCECVCETLGITGHLLVFL